MTPNIRQTPRHGDRADKGMSRASHVTACKKAHHFSRMAKNMQYRSMALCDWLGDTRL